MDGQPQHVIFGTGAIGLATSRRCVAGVGGGRLVNRSGTAPVPDEVEVLGGDAAKPPSPPAPPRRHVSTRPSHRPTTHGSSCYRTAGHVLAAAQATGARSVSWKTLHDGRPTANP